MESYNWQQNVLNNQAPRKLVRAFRTSGKTTLCCFAIKQAIERGKNVLLISSVTTYDRLIRFFQSEHRAGRMDVEPEGHAGAHIHFTNGEDRRHVEGYGMIYCVNNRSFPVITYEAIRLTVSGRRDIALTVIDEIFVTHDVIDYMISNQIKILMVGSHTDEFHNYLLNRYPIQFKYFEYNHIQAVSDGMIRQETIDDARRYYAFSDTAFKTFFGPWKMNQLNRELVSELELIYA